MKRACSVCGFTLIEIIVVLVILGILLGFAIPQYRFTVERARLAEGINVLGALRRAQLEYYDQWGDYAADSEVFAPPDVLNEIPIEKPQYFSEIALFRDQPDTRLAIVVRNDYQNSGDEHYQLGINATGTVGCCCDDGSGWCERFGFPPLPWP